MKHRALVAFTFIAFIATTAFAQVEPGWRPQLLVVDSLDDVQPWIAAPAAQRSADSGRLREIPTGMKVHFPIVVTGLPDRVMRLEADVEFIGPQGQVLWTQKACCKAVVSDTPQGRAVALYPVPNVQFEPNDTPGTYTVRAVVSDGQRSASTEETFRFGEPKRDAGATPGAPRLQMDVPKRNPGVDRDVRDCLGLPTPAEVIKCSERKK